LQHLYSDMGSRHKARRFEITIKQIEELTELVAA
jgi:ribosomal protein L20A (L18A)